MSLLVPFATRTALIYTIGIQYVGLNSLFTSVLSVLSFAELGIGSALVYAMYEPMAKGEESKICALLALYRKCYRVIGIVIVLLGLALMPFLDLLVSGDVPPDIDIRIIFLAYLLNTAISYLTFTYKQSLFVADQRVDVPSKLSAVTSAAMGALQIGALLATQNYYLYVLAIPIATLVNNLAIGYLTSKYYPDFRCKGSISRAELKDISKNVAGLVFVKVGSVVLTASDTLVVSAFLGLWTLGVYNGYSVLVTAAAGLMQGIQSAIIPTIGNKIALDSKESCWNAFEVLNLLYMWLSIFAFTCLVCLINPFVAIWQGVDNTLPVGISFLLCISFLVQRSGEMSWMFREAAGLWWQGRAIPFVSSFVNLALNLMLVQVIGLYGVVASTVIALLLVNLPLGAKVLFSNFFDSRRLLKGYLLQTTGYLVLGIAIGALSILLCDAIPVDGFCGLALRLAVAVAVSNSLLFVAFWRKGTFHRAIEMAKELANAKK